MPEDFENIKNEDNVLYHYVTTDKCRGFCYGICFEILKLLKEGEIRFMAVKKTESENDEEGSKDNEFTIRRYTICKIGVTFDEVLNEGE